MEASEKEEIRNRTDIVELVSAYTPLRKAGRAYKGLCPFHQEKTPSFTVDPERGRWHCFGACSTGGDVFKFLMMAEGLSFPEAAENLAKRVGVRITRGPDDNPERYDERDRIFAANNLALRFFRESFERATLARDYANKRGLAHETIQNFGIGYAPDDWEALAEYLSRNGCRLSDAEKAGLVSASRRGDGFIDKFRGRLVFPIYDVQERVVAFGGRLILPAENAPKYLNSPETPVFSKSRVLYALNRARKSIQDLNRVVVVEGYMDAVAAHQAGFPEVVATLGTALTPEHLQLLGRYTKNVILSFDADEAGVRAALRAAELFQGLPDFSLRVLALPAGEDPDSLLSRGKAPAFRKAIEKPLSVAEFRLRALEPRYDTKSEEGRQAFLREALNVLAEVSSPSEREGLIARVARFHPAFQYDALRVQKAIGEEINQMRQRRGAAGSPEPSFPDAPPVMLQGENLLPAARGRGGARQGGRGNAPYGGGRGGYRNGGSRWSPGPPPMESPPPQPRESAAEAAERIVLRAFLSAEWVDSVRHEIQPGFFSHPQTARLIENLQELIGGHFAPEDAIAQLADEELSAYADTILLAPESEPLSEQAIEDSIATLQRRQNQREIHQIRAQVSAEPEGKPLTDDELLRRWDQKAREMKRSRLTDADEEDE